MQIPDNPMITSALNSLIAVLVDGQKGYQQAADTTQDPALKTLFGDYSAQRATFAKELQSEASLLSRSTPDSSSSMASAFHRGWINLKSTLTGEDRHGLLVECERGEESAVKSYRQALANSSLNPSAMILVRRQHDAVSAAHNAIKKLRDESTPNK